MNLDVGAQLEIILEFLSRNLLTFLNFYLFYIYIFIGLYHIFIFFSFIQFGVQIWIKFHVFRQRLVSDYLLGESYMDVILIFISWKLYKKAPDGWFVVILLLFIKILSLVKLLFCLLVKPSNPQVVNLNVYRVVLGGEAQAVLYQISSNLLHYAMINKIIHAHYLSKSHDSLNRSWE